MARQLSQLIGQYLSEQLARSGEGEQQQMPQMGDSSMSAVGSDIISRLMEQMRDLVAAGRMREAAELLAALRNLVENSRVETMSAEAYQQMMENARKLDDLKKIAREQRDLANRTTREELMRSFREEMGETAEGLKKLGGEQQTLADRLDKLRQSLGEGGIDVPDSLGEAGEAMNGATDALGDNDGKTAQAEQARAMENLEDAINQIGNSLSSQLSDLRQQMSSSDPLGRPDRTDGGVEIPEAAEMEEVHRLLQELRGRLSDPSRPDEEIEYLRRLLRRF